MRTDPALPARVLAAVVFVPALAWVIHAGGWWWTGYSMLLLTLSLVEFYRMGSSPLPWWACAAGVAALAAFVAVDYPRLRAAGGLAALGLLVMAGVVAWVVASRRVLPPVSSVGRWALGFAYVGFLGYAMLALRLADGGRHTGVQATALAYVLAWTTDTGAYAVGMAVGRRPLAPAISPRKTWEGALGGLAASVLVGVVTGATVWRFLGAGRGALLGLLVGVAAQLGDLFESMLKREFKAKDSASWIPGHGGVLDRFDSLLAATPVVMFFLRWTVR